MGMGDMLSGAVGGLFGGGGGGGSSDYEMMYMMQLQSQQAQQQAQQAQQEQLNTMLANLQNNIQTTYDPSKYANYGGLAQTAPVTQSKTTATPVNQNALTNLAGAMTTNQNYGYRNYQSAPHTNAPKWGI